MEVIRNGLGIVGTISLALFGALLGYFQEESAAIWMLFLSITSLTGAFCLYWHQHSQQRRIFIWGVFTVILILSFGCLLGIWQQKVWQLDDEQGIVENLKPAKDEESSDTHIYLVGQEESYTRDEIGAAMAFHYETIEIPEGVSEIPNVHFPLRLFEWNYSDETKFYTLVVHNKGNATDANVKIDIYFDPNSTRIESINIDKENRVELIDGGIGGSYAEFIVNELVPDEDQDITLVTKGKELQYLRGWSENHRNIKMIYIMELVFDTLGFDSCIDDEKSFSIACPREWKTLPKDLLGNVSIFLADPEYCNGYLAQFTVWNGEIPEYDDNQDYLLVFKGEITQREGYEYISQERITLDGLSGLKVVHSIVENNNKIKSMIICILEGRIAWFLEFRAHDLCWNQYEPIFNTVSGSFKRVNNVE